MWFLIKPLLSSQQCYFTPTTRRRIERAVQVSAMATSVSPSCVLQTPAAASVFSNPDLLEQDFLEFVAQLVPARSNNAASRSDCSLPGGTHCTTDSCSVRAEDTSEIPVLDHMNSNFRGPGQSEAHPTWNPTPSVPDFYRKELTCNLAEGLEGLPSDAQRTTLLKRHRHSIDDAAAHNRPQPGQASLQHASSAGNSLERKRAFNRQAQKVFRNKQKDRAEAVETQLVNTMQELQELQARQQQLEFENFRLEKLQTMRKDESVQHITSDADICRQRFGDFEASNTAHGRGVVLSIPGCVQSISVQALATMDLSEFAKLWTAYISELATLLVQLGNNPSDAEQRQRLDQVTLESSHLMGIIKPLNVKVYKAILEGRLDEGSTGEQRLLDNHFYATLPNLVALSQEQIQDFLLLRRLYLTKRSLLAVEREALVSDLHKASMHELNSTESFAKMVDVSAKLRQNAAEDYLAYIKVACAARRGLVSTEQWATLIVHSYPYFCNLEKILESIAHDNGEPPMSEVLVAARQNPLKEEWLALDEYLTHVTKQPHAEYVPLFRPQLYDAALPVYHTAKPSKLTPLSHIHEMLL